jgi:uncharacterized repeat protein (TIGR01451 family)
MDHQHSSDLDRPAAVAGNSLWPHNSALCPAPGPDPGATRRGVRWLAWCAASALALALLPAVSASGDGQQLARSVTHLAVMNSALIAQSPRADVSVTVTAPNTVGVNTQLPYRIVVTNLGPDLAINVRVTDHLPAGLDYVSANASQGRSNISAGILRSELGSLLVGQTVVVNLIVIPRVTGPLVNGVAIQHDSIDTNPSNNSDGQLVLVTPFPPVFPPVVRTPETADPPCAADVTASIGLARGPLFYAPLTRRFLQQIILENRGSQPIRAPITLLVEDLAPINLTNASGFTGCWTPLGTPYLNVPVGADGVLAPDEVATVTLVMAIPPNRGVTYRTRVLGGPGGR